MAMAARELQEYASLAVADGLTQWLLVLILLALVIAAVWRMSLPSAATPTNAPGAWPRTVYAALDPRTE